MASGVITFLNGASVYPREQFKIKIRKSTSKGVESCVNNYTFPHLLLCSHSSNDVTPQASAEGIHSRGTGSRASVQDVSTPSTHTYLYFLNSLTCLESPSSNKEQTTLVVHCWPFNVDTKMTWLQAL